MYIIRQQLKSIIVSKNFHRLLITTTDHLPALLTTSLLTMTFRPFSHLRRPTLTGKGGIFLASPVWILCHPVSYTLIIFSGYIDVVSAANIPDTVPEQPLRPGEVTRGGLTPPVPVSTWRMTPTVAGQIAPPASREGAIIRVAAFSSSLTDLFTYFFQSLGRTTDVLANRHAKRTPYRLPPTPPPSVMQSEFEASMVSVPGPGSLTEGISVPMRTASVARPNARPAKSRSRPSEAVNQVIMCAKDRFHMMLLTTNAMWPDVTAFFRAQEQLVSACKSYGMDDSKL